MFNHRGFSTCCKQVFGHVQNKFVSIWIIHCWAFFINFELIPIQVFEYFATKFLHMLRHSYSASLSRYFGIFADNFWTTCYEDMETLYMLRQRYGEYR